MTTTEQRPRVKETNLGFSNLSVAKKGKVFSDMNLTPEQKNDIITYLKYIDENPSPGGFELGSIGPVAEGLFIWLIGLGGLIAIAIWLTARSN